MLNSVLSPPPERGERFFCDVDGRDLMKSSLYQSVATVAQGIHPPVPPCPKELQVLKSVPQVMCDLPVKRQYLQQHEVAEHQDSVIPQHPETLPEQLLPIGHKMRRLHE